MSQAFPRRYIGIGVGKVVKGQKTVIYFFFLITLPSHRLNVALTEVSYKIFVTLDKGARVCVSLCMRLYMCV